jgi:hypothetical protein
MPPNKAPSGANKTDSGSEKDKDLKGKAPKWTLVQHWERASWAKRLEWIGKFLGGVVALLVLGTYIWQNIQTSRNFKAEHHSHISITKLTLEELKSHAPIPDFKVGDPLAVDITFKNTGSEQAVNFIPRYHIVFGSAVSQIHADPSDKGSQGSPVDAGQEATVTPVSLIDAYSRPDAHLDPATVLSWNGSQPIILFGRFYYEDSDGESYCDPFMYQYVPPNNWGRMGKTDSGFKEKELCPP